MRDKPIYIKDITEEEWYAKLSEDGLSYEDECLVYGNEGVKIGYGCFVGCEYILNENNEIKNKDYTEITEDEYCKGTLKIIMNELNKERLRILNEFNEKSGKILKIVNMVIERFEN